MDVRQYLKFHPLQRATLAFFIIIAYAVPLGKPGRRRRTLGVWHLLLVGGQKCDSAKSVATA